MERRGSAGNQNRRYGFVQRRELHAVPRGNGEKVEIRQLSGRDAAKISERRRVRDREVSRQKPMGREGQEVTKLHQRLTG